MMIFIGADYQDLGLSQEQLQERTGKWMDWTEKMEAQGILIGGEALVPVRKRIVGKNRTVSDGPFTDSKEIIGGYYIVSAENAEKVTEIAQDYPDFDLDGTVEIREVMVFS